MCRQGAFSQCLTSLIHLLCIAVVAGLSQSSSHCIRIGTRPSPLARQQAESVATALESANPTISTELVLVESSGEHKAHRDAPTQPKPLAMSSIDFTSTIDSAILDGRVDVGVHSLKDVPPDHRWVHVEKLLIGAHLPRACPLDVLIGAPSLESLPRGARVGSASTRRQAQLLSTRPDIQPVNLRGNIQTRLQHLEDGLVDALVLARAGLDRLGISVDMTLLMPETMLPGPAQGIVGVICRQEDMHTRQLLQSIDDIDSRMAATAERAVLNTVDGLAPWPGRPPLASYMERDGQGWLLRTLLARPDGQVVLREEQRAPRECTVEEARHLGEQVGEKLLQRAGTRFFEEKQVT